MEESVVVMQRTALTGVLKTEGFLETDAAYELALYEAISIAVNEGWTYRAEQLEKLSTITYPTTTEPNTMIVGDTTYGA